MAAWVELVEVTCWLLAVEPDRPYVNDVWRRAKQSRQRLPGHLALHQNEDNVIKSRGDTSYVYKLLTQ